MTIWEHKPSINLYIYKSQKLFSGYSLTDLKEYISQLPCDKKSG